MARRDETPAEVALGSLGIGLVVAPLLLLPALAHGGLAPLAVAGAVAAMIGVPAALAEWRNPAPESGPARATLHGLGELAGIVIVAAGAAEVARGGLPWLVTALLVWPLGALLGRRSWGIAVPALAAILVAAVGGAIGAAEAPPWTLLKPHWNAGEDWLGPALLAGLWLGGAATGQFVVGPARRPGENRAPWAIAGVGVLLAVALALRAGAHFEATLGAGAPDPWVLAAASFGLAAAVGTLGRRRALRPAPRVAIGALVTLWLVGTGAAGAAFVAQAVLPVLAALALAWVAARGRDGRIAAGLAAAVSAVAVLIARPELPAHAGEAAAIGLLLVAGFWLVATRAVLSRGAA